MGDTAARHDGAPPLAVTESRLVPIAELVHFPGNAKDHDLDAIRESIRENKVFRAVVVNTRTKPWVILAGNGTVEAHRLEGYDQVYASLVDVDDETAVRINLVDNRAPELGATRQEALAGLLRRLNGNLQGTGYKTRDLDRLLAQLRRRRTAVEDLDAAPEKPASPVTRPGDVWMLGPHRLLCGDATDEEAVLRLLESRLPDCILMDPPYSSGGFQEAGRSVGSIGVRNRTKSRTERPSIENDQLSTRGYIALLRGVLSKRRVPLVYVFTDWRMWSTLADTLESEGYGVRGMLVWDKGTPGMGRGWRAQHELIAMGARSTPKFELKGSRGNVVQAKRTGNLLHRTQKPVDLLAQVVETTSMARTFYDPMAGSGSTLIACHDLERACYAMELDPGYCDVTVERFQRHTGIVPRREEKGEHDFMGKP